MELIPLKLSNFLLLWIRMWMSHRIKCTSDKYLLVFGTILISCMNIFRAFVELWDLGPIFSNLYHKQSNWKIWFFRECPEFIGISVCNLMKTTNCKLGKHISKLAKSEAKRKLMVVFYYFMDRVSVIGDVGSFIGQTAGNLHGRLLNLWDSSNYFWFFITNRYLTFSNLFRWSPAFSDIFLSQICHQPSLSERSRF